LSEPNLTLFEKKKKSFDT